MNKKFTKEELAQFVADMLQAAREDEHFSYAIFAPTEESHYVIVGGWHEGFDPDDIDLFCLSKTEPTNGMCIKIVENDGPWAYAEYDLLNMPMDETGEVDDTSLALEWEDDPTLVAEFFECEWERLMSV